jgi:hypothetical protein
VWARLSTAGGTLSYFHKIYDYMGNLLGANYNILTTTVASYSATAYSLPNTALPYGLRYVPWYQELAETRYYSGGQPPFLQWSLYIRDAMSTNSSGLLKI